jgi:CRISPR system Cascade subunit CasE
MYLSRVRLDVRNAAVRRDLADLHAMHRTVMSGFPDDLGPEPRAQVGALWRLEPVGAGTPPVLLVQSATLPDWTHLPPGYLVDPMTDVRSIDPLLAALRVGAHFRFRLRANPTRKIDTKSGPHGERRNGRRVPLRGDEECLAWLARKAADCGFAVGSTAQDAARAVVVRHQGDATGRRDAGGEPPVTVRSVLFEGVLTVRDCEQLRGALAAGIGPGRAHGCGLLSIAPA